jgi:hypothetical protein
MLDEEKKIFCKLNCKWGKIARGPKKNSSKNPPSIPVTITINADLHDFITKQAIYKSSQVGKIIHCNDLIREALAIAFPAPKQRDMFGGQK